MPSARPMSPRLKLETENLPITRDDTPVTFNDDDMEEGIPLTLREELELFGNPPPSPRGLPTGRPRRQIKTPVGFAPTTNDRYLNPLRERYVPHRDPTNSPFADIPFTATTEKYRAPRRRTSTTTIRRRPSSVYTPKGLPPLSRPLRYETPTSTTRRSSSVARPKAENKSTSSSTSSRPADKA